MRDHYLVITRIKGKMVSMYDPMTDKESDADVTKIPDSQPSFVMLLSKAPGEKD